MDGFKWAADSAEESKCKIKNNNLMTFILKASGYITKGKGRVELLQFFSITWQSQGKGEI